MKTFRMIAMCMCAALIFSACGKAASSSGGQSGSVPAQAASEPLPAPSAPEAPAASASTSEQEPDDSEPDEPEPDERAQEPVTMNAAPSFLSLPVTETDGTEGEKVLIVLHVPESWAFDQYITFSRGEMKIAEFPRLWRAANGASPFTAGMLAPYQSDGTSPEEGAATAEDLELNGNRLRVLHLQTWMSDSEEIWYLHCAFYAVDGYVVETHLYTVQEWGGADSEELLAALRTLEVYSGEENAGT